MEYGGVLGRIGCRGKRRRREPQQTRDVVWRGGGEGIKRRTEWRRGDHWQGEDGGREMVVLREAEVKNEVRGGGKDFG